MSGELRSSSIDRALPSGKVGMTRSPTNLGELTLKQLESVVQQALSHQDYALAERACVQLQQVDSSHPIPYWVLAQIERHRGQNHLAVESLRRCVALQPDKRSFRLALAKCLRQEREVGAALEQLDELLQRDPSCTAALIEKADLLEHVGRYSELDTVIADLATQQVDGPQVTLIRASAALHQGQLATAIDLTKPFLSTDNVDREQRAGLLFVCGQAYGKLAEPEKALRALGVANRLLCIPLDRRAFQEDVDRTLAFFNRERFERETPIQQTTLPIFIACLPRSGSTLLEQLIAAHPDAAGAGELDFFYNLRRNMMQRDRLNYPRQIERMSADALRRIATGYLDRIERFRGPRTSRVADKSIENYRELGLISMLFPRAHLIHLKRNTLDCCLSMYMHPFYHLASLTSSLRDIGFFYRQHERCMKHWRDVAGLRILEVSYEALVRDSEHELRRILDFCGLSWDPSCLEFHQSERLLRTLSYHQASQPIYETSIGVGEPYRPYVGELLEELEHT